MYKTVLHAKLHGIEIAMSELHYEGSCGIPLKIMTDCDIDVYEQIHIYNINNGKRFITYAVEASQNRGIELLGAAARCGEVGDKVIVAAYRSMNSKDPVPSPFVWRES